MRISFGVDERNHVSEAVRKYLKKMGYRITFYGPAGKGSTPWPEVARCVAEDVANGRADEGIVCCWTGTGVCIAANKVPGIRAALCNDAETARGARLWNNANVLCLSLRATSEPIAQEILKTWFETQYEPNHIDDACLRQIRQLEVDYTNTKQE
jgi:ribose 5-phosphate isomerase B